MPQFFSNKKDITINKAEQNNNVIIMDDGLQDISIAKNLNIICFNGQNPIGNGFLIPAGPLRERLIQIKIVG